MLAESGQAYRRKVLIILVAMVRSMEKMVGDPMRPDYVRAYAWFKLVKIWSCATLQRYGGHAVQGGHTRQPGGQGQDQDYGARQEGAHSPGVRGEGRVDLQQRVAHGGLRDLAVDEQEGRVGEKGLLPG